MSRFFSKISAYKREKIFPLMFIVFVFIILRFPSLFEPHWYGDEGIYQVIGMALNKGRILYEGIWDNKPPLLYIIYAFFNSNLFFVKLLSLTVGVISVVIFYFFSNRLFSNKISIYISSVFFSILFAIPLIEGNIANAENFMLLPIIAAFYFALFTPLKKIRLNYFISGILLSIAFLIKTVAVFDLSALLILTVLTRLGFSREIHAKKISKAILDILAIIIAFSLPILTCILYLSFQGALGSFFRAAFFQNVGYVGIENDLLFPMGLLTMKLIMLGLGVFLVIKYRTHLKLPGGVIIVWLLFSLFSALFSQRSYNHYLLILLPSYSLLLGLLFEKVKKIKILIPLIISIPILINYIFTIKPTEIPDYYSNFLSFVFGQKSIDDYRAYFDRRAPLDYNIADFIVSRTGDDENIFLWGDNAQIYTLSNKLPPGRYVVSYHITYYPNAIEETKYTINNVKPKYIIQTVDTPEIRYFLDNYELRYKMEGANIYERKN